MRTEYIHSLRAAAVTLQDKLIWRWTLPGLKARIVSKFSIAVLTLNEEAAIGPCLDSVSWADDVLVFDSYSKDRTAAIALEKGARVIQHPFSGYASQRTACLEQGAFKHDWVFMLDADERFTPELRDEIELALGRPDSNIGLYRLRRKDYFLGTWIKRSGGYPTWFGRLMRPASARISREINELYETSQDVGYLREHILHEPFSKGIAHWLDRHNRYSSMEAAVLEQQAPFPPLVEFLSPDPAARRRALKALYYRVPFRPLLAFLYLYLFRLGFLEGRAGFYYSILRAHYEFCINIKRFEASSGQRKK